MKLDSEPQSAICSCGSVWFELQPFVAVGEVGLGALQVTSAGRILAVSGVYICLDCGVPLDEGQVEQPKLRLVN